MAKFGAEEIWHQFLNAAATFGTDSQTSKNTQGPGMVVVMSYGPLVGCGSLSGASGWALEQVLVLLEAVGDNGTVHAKSAHNGPIQKRLRPSNTMAYFDKLSLCQLLPFHCCLFLIRPLPGTILEQDDAAGAMPRKQDSPHEIPPPNPPPPRDIPRAFCALCLTGQHFAPRGSASHLRNDHGCKGKRRERPVGRGPSASFPTIGTSRLQHADGVYN